MEVLKDSMMSTWKSQLGFTLVELLIAITIVSILAAIGIPSFQQTMDKKRLVGAADNLLADMRYAKSESIKRDVPVQVTFTDGANWSYVFDTAPNTPKTTYGSDYKGTTLAVMTTGKLFTFDPIRGTLLQAPANTSALVTITSALGSKLSLEVDPLSRMRLCTSTGLGGYPACI